ncbi:hypothetical protein D1007_57696 [Hordeum vulgare]|nr:hypothetical protein D1007_57696 [Hordeum vulgare]
MQNFVFEIAQAVHIRPFDNRSCSETTCLLDHLATDRDSPAAFIQAKINSKRRKAFVHSLHGPAGIITSEEDKEKVIHEHFSSLFGTSTRRGATIHWSALDLPSLQGGGLDNPFTKEEVLCMIKASLEEHSLGPDIYSGTFFRACSAIIKDDIMAAFGQFYNIAGRNFGARNSPIVALLPKKDGATSRSMIEGGQKRRMPAALDDQPWSKWDYYGDHAEDGE